jgi:uncharacterized protein (DUF427 family)
MSLTLGAGPLAGTPAGALNFSLDAAPAHRILFEPYGRRLRAVLGGRTILDSARAHLLHETGIPPVAYVPFEDLDPSLLTRTETSTHCPFKGDASYWTVRAGDRVVEDALWGYPEPTADAPWLAGLAALYWDRVDAWFIEDERVFGHLKDPYHRVDVYETDRPVRVLRGDDVLAETTRAKLLFETSLPRRVYVPGGDVAPGVLVPSESTSVCPYKGTASYWAVDGAADAAWSYETPLPEALKVQGHVCFDAADGLQVEVGAPIR